MKKITIRVAFNVEDYDSDLIQNIISKFDFENLESCRIGNLEYFNITKNEICEKVAIFQAKEVYGSTRGICLLGALIPMNSKYGSFSLTKNYNLEYSFEIVEVLQRISTQRGFIFGYIYDTKFEDIQHDHNGFFHRIYNMLDQIPVGTPKSMLGYEIDTSKNFGRRESTDEILVIPSWYSSFSLQFLHKTNFYKPLIEFIKKYRIHSIEYVDTIEFMLFPTIDDTWNPDNTDKFKALKECFGFATGSE